MEVAGGAGGVGGFQQQMVDRPLQLLGDDPDLRGVAGGVPDADGAAALAHLAGARSGAADLGGRLLRPAAFVPDTDLEAAVILRRLVLGSLRCRVVRLGGAGLQRIVLAAGGEGERRDGGQPGRGDPQRTAADRTGRTRGAGGGTGAGLDDGLGAVVAARHSSLPGQWSVPRRRYVLRSGPVAVLRSDPHLAVRRWCATNVRLTSPRGGSDGLGRARHSPLPPSPPSPRSSRANSCVSVLIV